MIIAYNNYYSDACQKVISYSYFHTYICSLEFHHKEKLYLIPHLFIQLCIYHDTQLSMSS